MLLLIACIPLLGLRSGAPTAQSLATSSHVPAKLDSVARRRMATGWTAPFEIAPVTRKGAVTTQPRLTELALTDYPRSRASGCRSS